MELPTGGLLLPVGEESCVQPVGQPNTSAGSSKIMKIPDILHPDWDKKNNFKKKNDSNVEDDIQEAPLMFFQK